MNVIVIISDEHSYSAMGNSGHNLIKTPNLDKMAKLGTSFNNCYTPGPICVPARASLVTGQYTNCLGTWDNGTPYAGDGYDVFKHCKANDVDCTYIGRLDMHGNGEYNGLKGNYYAMRTSPDIGGLFRQSNIPRPNAIDRFDDGIFEKTDLHPDTKYTNIAVDFINNQTDSKPFVMFLGYAHPHFPFGYKKEYWDYYNPLVKKAPDIALPPFDELNGPLKELRNHFSGDYPNEELIRQCHVGYYSLITEMDDNIGKVIKAVEDNGLLEDTLIIYTSDHGEQLGHHGLWWKCCMYENSVHVPLIMYGGKTRIDAKTDKTASLVDIFPTICEATGISIPDTVQGESLLPAAYNNQYSQCRDFLFSEYHGHGMPVGMFMIKYKHYKYVYYSKTDEQLFDLEADPDEMDNLLSSSITEEISQILLGCKIRLNYICDPDEVSDRALSEQAKRALDNNVTEYTRESCKRAATKIKAFFPIPIPPKKITYKCV